MIEEIKFYETERGVRLVQQFVRSFDSATQTKISCTFDLLLSFGPMVGPKFSKKVSKNIFELRVVGNVQIRLLYCYHEGAICVLHGFVKKTAKIPLKDLKIAQWRLKSL